MISLSFLFVLLGGSTDEWSVGGVESGESSKGESSNSLGLEWQVLDGLSDSVKSSSEFLS